MEPDFLTTYEDGSQSLIVPFRYVDTLYNTYPVSKTMEELELLANARIQKEYNKIVDAYRKFGWCVFDKTVMTHSVSPDSVGGWYNISYITHLEFTRTATAAALYSDKTTPGTYYYGTNVENLK